MECREEVERLTREYGLDEHSASKLVCLLGYLAFRAMKGVADRLSLDLSRLENLEIDPEGPRVILRLSSWWRVRELYLDMSPDGAEMVITINAKKGLRKESYEEAVSTVIEESDQFQGVEEYDVAYSPSDGTVTLTLRSRLLAEMPSIREIVEAVDRALGYYG